MVNSLGASTVQLYR